MLGFSAIGDVSLADVGGASNPATPIEPDPPEAARLGGFEVVDLEPTWKRALRLRAEAKERVEQASRKARKRAELLEKLAAKAALSNKPEPEIAAKVSSLLQEWIDTAPLIDKQPAAQVKDRAYDVFLAHVAEQIRRMQEDDEAAVEMLLLM